MKNIQIVISGLIILFSLTLTANVFADESKQGNYVVVLDLSDRVLLPNQAKGDIAVIKNVYAKFVSDVKSHLIIKSKAKFSVHILSQKNSELDVIYFNEKLSIDMELYSIAEKRRSFDKFSNELDALLNDLYKKARYSESKSDYNGVDVWRYFNELLVYSVFDNSNNSLYVLTDGYFDFESNNNIKRSLNRYTSTNFLSKLNGDSWHIKAVNNDFGLLAINSKFTSLNVVVIGVNPKNGSLNEREKLHYFWNKWLKEMGAKAVIIDKTSIMKTKQRMLYCSL
ncbi:MAG: hypothetical protein DRI86_08720 [Bacteroidetes bacterium]|nr:MAG: hypothetical protein DRI86_08720 [Bacteroidota bacterium]